MQPMSEAQRQYRRRNTIIMGSLGAIVVLVLLSALWRGQSGPAEVAPPASGPTGTWASAGSMAVGREFPEATLLADGTVLVTGGFAKDQRVAAAELFNPVTRTWSPAGSLEDPARRRCRCLIGIGGRHGHWRLRRQSSIDLDRGV